MLICFKDLVFPGIDEVFAMRSMLYDFRSGKWDMIVFDTAPTGHTLRALNHARYVGCLVIAYARHKKEV